MTQSRLRLDPSSLTAAVALALAAALANGVWILMDHSSPSWDQAHYLSTALQYRDALHVGGPMELLHSIERADPSHGPFFTIVLLPALWIFGASNSSGLLVNLLAAPILYLAAGEIAYILFRSGFARLLTIFLVATTPILVGLLHNVLQDYLLVTLTTLSLLLLLKSEGFRRRWITWAMALTMGLGTLTKVTFPLFVVGPFLVVLAEVVCKSIRVRRRPVEDGEGAALRPTLLNLGGAALIYLAVALAWYGPKFSETLDYVRSTTGGPLALGAGPSDPYTLHAVTSFTLGVINFNLSWVIVILGIAGVILSWSRLRSLFQKPVDPEPLWKLAFLLVWALIPYLSVATAHNQDVRLMAPAFPAVALLAAGAVTAIPKRKWRLALAAVVVVVLGYQTLNHMTDITPGFVPDRLRVAIAPYEATIPLNSEQVGYERLPESDYVTPIFEYVEELAAREGGDSGVGTICLLESEPLINSNTLGFMSAARGDAFGFADIVQGPTGTETELEDILSGCDFALYAQPPKPTSESDESRLTLVNEPYAASHMTKSMFRLFEGPTKVFPIAPNGATGEATDFQGTAGGIRVRILTRTP
ncbi:MAG: hypothetical protein ACJ76D_06585 [Solirubrobacterales bacterium]